MEYRNLGATGLRVAELALGAMTFGRETDEKTAHEMLDRYVAAGGNFIDTADAYEGPAFTGGPSEEVLGRWLAGRDRDGLVIATKVRWGTGPGPNEQGLSRKHIIANAERSLRRLRTDHLDLYQVHAWDPAVPLEETLSALDTLVRDGKVRYLGASNVAGWQLQRAVDLARERGWEPFRCLQPLYNLLDREAEWELLPACRAGGLGVIPWSPLRGGWLTGKFDRSMAAAPAGTRVEKASEEGWSEDWASYATERTWRVVDTLREIAAEQGRTPSQVALRWLLQQPGVTAPIIGARTLEQFEDNLGAADWSLPTESLTRLTTASNRPLPYPYFLLADL